MSRYWENNNGTWSHHKDAQREWQDKTGCLTDLRFHDEYDGNANVPFFIPIACACCGASNRLPYPLDMLIMMRHKCRVCEGDVVQLEDLPPEAGEDA